VTEQPEPTSAVAEQLNAAIEIVEALTPMLAAVSGWRAKCMAEGFAPANAEVMAVQLHGALVAMMFKQPSPSMAALA
jgi:hypothetical protein